MIAQYINEADVNVVGSRKSILLINASHYQSPLECSLLSFHYTSQRV